MFQKRLNNCVLADDIAREFIMVNGERIKYFGCIGLLDYIGFQFNTLHNKSEYT